MQSVEVRFDPDAAAAFAALLGRSNAPLNLRAFPPTSASADIKKRLGARKLPWGDIAQIEQVQREGRGVYAVINPGGDSKTSITHAIAYWAESDQGTKDEQYARLLASGLPRPTFIVDTGGRSLHFYWVLRTWLTDLATWQRDQKRIARLLGSDSSVSDPSRVMRLPGAWYLDADLQPVAPTVICDRSGPLYSPEEVLAALPAEQLEVPPPPPATPPPWTEIPSTGTRGQERAALEQLQRIPQRIPGTETRDDYLRLLWGLAAIVGPADAGRLMAQHSPAWAAAEDLIEKAGEARGDINAATFFHVAKSVFGVTGPRRTRPLQPPPAAPPPPPPAAQDEMAAISAEAHRLHCLPPNDATRTDAVTALIRRFVDAVHGQPGSDALISDFLDGLSGLITRQPAKAIVRERRKELDRAAREAAKQERLDRTRARARNHIQRIVAALPTPPDSKVDAGQLIQALRTPETPIPLRHNLLTDGIELDGIEIDPPEVELAHVYFQEAGWRVGRGDTYDSLLALAREDSYHPIREYLDRVQLDATLPDIDLDTLAASYLGTKDPLHAQMLKVALIGAVRRVRKPACQHDTVLVFQGVQGCGKTTFWKALAGPWYSPCSSEKTTDMLLAMHRSWIVEFAELEGITSRHEIAALRHLITNSEDHFRKPYGRVTTVNKRHFLLVGTVNPHGFLNDPEGHRRFHCIPIPDGWQIDTERAGRERDAIWRAAALAEAAGEASFLSPIDQKDSNLRNQGSHQVETAWDGPIEDWTVRATIGRSYSVAEVLVESGLRSKDHIQPHDYGRVAQILKSLGWERDPGTAMKKWRRPTGGG